MKSITSILALLAVGTTLALADDKPAAPAAGDTKPAAGDTGKPKRDPAEVFKKLDANGDGKLTLDEYMASPMAKKDPDKAKARFQKMANGADSITLEQWVAASSGGKKGNK
jgi:hypothetical protein